MATVMAWRTTPFMKHSVTVSGQVPPDWKFLRGQENFWWFVTSSFAVTFAPIWCHLIGTIMSYAPSKSEDNVHISLPIKWYNDINSLLPSSVIVFALFFHWWECIILITDGFDWPLFKIPSRKTYHPNDIQQSTLTSTSLKRARSVILIVHYKTLTFSILVI